MRSLLIVLTALILLTSCMSKKYLTVEGDVHFELIDFLKIYDAPDSVINKFEKEFPKIAVDFDTIYKNDKEYYDIVKYGIEQNLLRTPYLWIETNKGRKIMLFMDKESFKQFENIKCFDLSQQKKKIHILAKAQDISHQDLQVYKMIKLIKVERVDGETKCIK